MNKDNKVLNDNEIETVTGGTDHLSVRTPWFEKEVPYENNDEKPDAPVVGCFVGLPGLP